MDIQWYTTALTMEYVTPNKGETSCFMGGLYMWSQNFEVWWYWSHIARNTPPNPETCANLELPEEYTCTLEDESFILFNSRLMDYL